MNRTGSLFAGPLAGLLVAAMAASPATGQMSFVSRESRVYAWERIVDLGGNDLGVDANEATSTSLLSFDRSVSGGGYTAQQQSSLLSSQVVVNCAAFGTPQSMGWGGAESRFVVVFDVAAAATFRLEGVQSRFIGDAIVSLAGPGTNTTIYSNAGSWPVSTPFAYEGTMSGGRYTLEIITSSDWGSVQATLTVIPSPATLSPFAMFICACRRQKS